MGGIGHPPAERRSETAPEMARSRSEQRLCMPAQEMGVALQDGDQACHRSGSCWSLAGTSKQPRWVGYSHCSSASHDRTPDKWAQAAGITVQQKVAVRKHCPWFIFGFANATAAAAHARPSVDLEGSFHPVQCPTTTTAYTRLQRNRLKTQHVYVKFPPDRNNNNR
jgi:hypothetical protein